MLNPQTKLLIVDDEPVILLLMTQIFSALGYSVRSAEDGFGALEMIRETVPDILLSDLNMPGMSGFELLSVVRRRLPGIYVIATSGAFSGREVPTGIPADAFYEKASGLTILLELVRAQADPELRWLGRSFRSIPIWIPPSDYASPGSPVILISCPECLRTFEQALSDSGGPIHVTQCVHCRMPIPYAIVQELCDLPARTGDYRVDAA